MNSPGVSIRWSAPRGLDAPGNSRQGGHSCQGGTFLVLTRDEGKECPPAAYRTMFRFGFISSKNSIRVDSRVRNTPSIAEVTALAFSFSTPRIIMHR